VHIVIDCVFACCITLHYCSYDILIISLFYWKCQVAILLTVRLIGNVGELWSNSRMGVSQGKSCYIRWV